MSIKYLKPFTKIEDYELFPIEKCHQLVKNGNTTCPEDLTMIIKYVRVKYLPKKFNKITVILDNTIIEELLKIQKHFKNDIGTEDFIKDNTLSLKLNPNTKILTEALKIGSTLNIAVKFNGVWKMTGKQYVSWKLVDFEEVQEEKINYFNVSQ